MLEILVDFSNHRLDVAVLILADSLLNESAEADDCFGFIPFQLNIAEFVDYDRDVFAIIGNSVADGDACFRRAESIDVLFLVERETACPKLSE